MKSLIEKIAYGIVITLMIPLFLLNTLGGIVGGIMLLFGGDWQPVVLGIVIMLLSIPVISLLMLPMLLFISIISYFYRRKNVVGLALTVFVSQSYLYGLIFGIGYSIFGAMQQFAPDANNFALIIWAFAVASGPWTYMASKEGDNNSTQSTLLVTQVGLLVVVIALLCGVSLDDVFDVVRALVVIPILFSTWFAIQLVRNRGDALLMGEDETIGAYTRHEVTLFILALLEIARTDGKLDAAEIKRVRKIFKDITGEGVSSSFVEQIYDGLERDAFSFDRELSDSEDTISDEIKTYIVKGAVLVAATDGKLDEDEVAEVKRIGKKLHISEAELMRIIKG